KYGTPRPVADPPIGNRAPGENLAARDADGVCLANYRISDATVHFFLSDDCAESQLHFLMPMIGGYAAGFLEHLFRGGLAVTVEGGRATVSVPANETQLGAGQLTYVAEDGSGHRKVIGTGELKDSAAGFDVPSHATRVFAVFKGVDAAGETLIAVGSGTAK